MTKGQIARKRVEKYCKFPVHLVHLVRLVQYYVLGGFRAKIGLASLSTCPALCHSGAFKARSWSKSLGKVRHGNCVRTRRGLEENPWVDSFLVDIKGIFGHFYVLLSPNSSK